MYACRGSGASSGADCVADGGPDTPDQTNTSPRAASQGMVYFENATHIAVVGCMLRAGGIAGLWLQESNLGHTISGNWVQDMGGFGLYVHFRPLAFKRRLIKHSIGFVCRIIRVSLSLRLRQKSQFLFFSGTRMAWVWVTDDTHLRLLPMSTAGTRSPTTCSLTADD